MVSQIHRLALGAALAAAFAAAPFAVAAPLDFDGDGVSEPVGLENQRDGSPNELVYRIPLSSNGELRRVEFGSANDLPVPGDYDGDGTADLAVVRRNDDALEWRIRSSAANDDTVTVSFGSAGDTVIAGCDVDADGRIDPGTANGTSARFAPSGGGAVVEIALGRTFDAFACADLDGAPGDELFAAAKTRTARGKPGRSIFAAWRSDGSELERFRFGRGFDGILALDANGDGAAELGSYVRGVRARSRLLLRVDGRRRVTRVPRFDELTYGSFGGGAAAGFAVRPAGRAHVLRYESLADDSPDQLSLGDSEELVPSSRSESAGGIGAGCDVERDPFDGNEGFLWKPVSETTGNAVVLFPAGMHLTSVTLVKDGEVLESLRYSSTANGGREHFRSNRRASSFPSGMTVAGVSGGSTHCWQLGNPNVRHD